MNTKIIGCISLAVALGATASEAVLLQKPTVINSRVYVNTPKTTTSSVTITNNKNIKKVPVTLYEFKPVKPSNINKNNPEYLATEEPTPNQLVPGANKWIPIGQATLKNTTSNTTPGVVSGSFADSYIKKTIELPIGTKLNVLWIMDDTVAIDYNGTEAFLSKSYFDLSNVPTNRAVIMRKVSKEYLKNIHYIGKAKIQNYTMPGEGIPTSKPMLIVPFNGVSYPLTLKPGTEVNVVKKGGEVHIKVKDNPNVKGVSYPVSAVVEYNGIIGALQYQNLGPITK